ncbi:hypothetical protein M9Y10_034022 [Tritrichomonas musculus]|uniref:Mediator complex subunit 4 n=1 Tax=Tritrichomonas musculus TaxID=1915356 RepID=A0ABR2KEI3_9EUKA
MSGKRKLIDEMADNLSEYKENFEKILESIMNQCDSNVKRHDSQIADNVLKLIQTDIELKKNIEKMKIWKKRQRQIDILEKQLASLSTKVNQFAKSVSKEQRELQLFMLKARKLQNGVSDPNNISTIKNIITTAKVIGPAASGARRDDVTYPWMPDPYQMAQGVNALKTLDLPAPSVAAHSISLDPVIMTRNAVVTKVSSSSSSGSDESDE